MILEGSDGGRKMEKGERVGDILTGTSAQLFTDFFLLLVLLYIVGENW